MDIIYSNCCGLDVHKRSVHACVRKHVGKKIHQSTRIFGTMTQELLELRDWLKEEEVTHVAMESTGVFWKPIYNILEDSFTLFLVNARHVKNVAGRKTDVKDCQWLAQLLQSGLLEASFVPARPQRELRDLTRNRSKLVSQRASVVNRIHKVLEDTNVKIGSVVTDILGKSGKDMIRALLAGQTDPETIAQLARGSLKEKIPQLCRALQGHLTEHHRFVLAQHLDHLDYLEKQIETYSLRIEELMRPFEAELKAVCSLPGFERRNAQNVLAEIGCDMGRFPTDRHLAKWSGVCPGNNQTAGKSKSGKIAHGDKWLRVSLVQAAWAASRKKDSYFQAQFTRISKRRGARRAIMAVAHSLLTTIYFLLKRKTEYKDLGVEHFNRFDIKGQVKYHTRRLKSLGYEITIKPVKEAA